MTADIGLGLLLNILVWIVVVAAAVGLGSLAVIEYFPGRKPKAPEGTGGGPRGTSPDKGSVEPHGAGPRYRKAS